jgi:hypothetical protein
MYITLKSLKKTLGKYIEYTDLYIALPSIILFLILFVIKPTRIISLVFISTVLFMLIPINLSKKNRMYKIIIMFISYALKCKKYIYKNML